MKTVARYLVAIAIFLLSGIAIAGALGIIAFALLRIFGVDGASWLAVGYMLIAFGIAMIGLWCIDQFDIGGDK